MFVPIILGSDKTTVSVATGQHEFHPIYLSVGNVHNCVRRAHKDALVLIGFLPIPKGEYLVLLEVYSLTDLQVPEQTQTMTLFETFAVDCSMDALPQSTSPSNHLCANGTSSDVLITTFVG